MLAQNFKTPAELGIKDAEFMALAKLCGMLERGELEHVEIKDQTAFYDMKLPIPTEPTTGFNMGNIYLVDDCKTAACIAGSCDLFFGTKFAPDGDSNDDWPSKLRELFCPPGMDDEEWGSITVAQAACALRSYLTTGEPRWDEALAS